MKHPYPQSRAIALKDPAPAIRLTFWRVILVVTVMAAFAAIAGAQTIKDGGEFFSPQAREAAQQKLGDWAKQHKKSVVIETFQTLPGNVGSQFATADEATKRRLVGEFSLQRMASAKADIYLLVNRSPGLVRVRTEKSIGQPEAQKLAGDVLAAMQRRDYDGGLAAFVSDLSQMNGSANTASTDGGDMLSPSAFPGGSAQNSPAPRQADAPARSDGNAPAASTPASGLGCGSFGGIFGLVVLFIIIMLIVRVIRGIGNRNRYNGPPGQGYGPQNPGQRPGYGQPGQPGYDPNYQQQAGNNRGGGFGTGVAGGLAGGLLGGWLGSKVFGGQSNPDAGAGAGGAAGADQNAADQNYSEFQGGDAGGEFDSGSDFGGDAGGDFGGGGDAGGDF